METAGFLFFKQLDYKLNIIHMVTKIRQTAVFFREETPFDGFYIKIVFRFVSDGPGQANLSKSSEKFMKKVSGKLFVLGEFKVIDVCSKRTFVVCSKAYIGNVLVGRSFCVTASVIIGMPSSFAFLFFDDVEFTSLLIK